MIKAKSPYKCYYLFTKKEAKTEEEAILLTSRHTKESRKKYVCKYADIDTDTAESTIYDVEKDKGKYYCVFKKGAK